MSGHRLLDRLHATIPFQAGMLALTVMLATASLALADRLTRRPIAEAIAEDTRRSLAQVLPADSYDNDPTRDIVHARDGDLAVTVHVARRAGVPTGVVIATRARGYGGEIGLVVGVSRDQRVLGVRITRHAETPGLGDKIELAKSDWVHSFAGRHLADPDAARWAVRKDGGEFDQFAGATITPRAVVAAVKSSLELYRREHHEWFARRDPS